MTTPKHIPPGEDIFDLMGMHILITGNPADGFEYFGPFKTGEEAVTFGNKDAHIGDHEWWIAPLYGVEELE